MFLGLIPTSVWTLCSIILDGKILIYGDGRQQRPFIALSNLVGILIKAITDENSTDLFHAINFNADMNGLMNWLKQNYLSELEYTYINPNFTYEGQFVEEI